MKGPGFDLHADLSRLEAEMSFVTRATRREYRVERTVDDDRESMLVVECEVLEEVWVG